MKYIITYYFYNSSDPDESTLNICGFTNSKENAMKFAIMKAKSALKEMREYDDLYLEDLRAGGLEKEAANFQHAKIFGARNKLIVGTHENVGYGGDSFGDYCIIEVHCNS